MSECEDHTDDPDPEDQVEQLEFMTDLEMDQVADKYFEDREQMLERGRP